MLTWIHTLIDIQDDADIVTLTHITNTLTDTDNQNDNDKTDNNTQSDTDSYNDWRRMTMTWNDNENGNRHMKELLSEATEWWLPGQRTHLYQCISCHQVAVLPIVPRGSLPNGRAEEVALIAGINIECPQSAPHLTPGKNSDNPFGISGKWSKIQ